MSKTFGEGGDQATDNGDQNNGQGTSFGAKGNDDSHSQGTGGEGGLSIEEVEALVKRDSNAQEHIKNLEAETKGFRDRISALEAKDDETSIPDDLLDKLNKLESSDPNSNDLVERVTQAVTDDLSKREALQVQQENFKRVSQVVQSKFGENADVEMSKVAAENGMTLEGIIQMSHTNPKLVENLLGVASKSSSSQSTSQGQSGYNEQIDDDKPVNVMDLRTDAKRVADFNRRMDKKLKELNQS